MTSLHAFLLRRRPRTGGMPQESPPPETNLISLYALDGGTAIDSESGVDGTIVSNWTATDVTSLVDGVVGTAFYKDININAHIILPADNPAHDLDTVSLVFYYQPTSSAAKHVIFAAHTPFAGAPGNFSIERLTNGRLRVWHYGQDGALRYFESTNGIAATNLVNGTAYRIALVLGPLGAHLYLDDVLVASIPENQNGWNNTIDKYVGIWTNGTQDPMQGVIDYIRIFDGELSLSGVQALEDAQSIAIAIDDNIGVVPPSTATSVDVAANDILADGLALNISIASDPFGRLSVNNNNTVDAQIVITTPEAPEMDTNENGTYKIAENGGPLSNIASVTWVRQASAGSYTPFAFVTISNPSVSHPGSSRPGFSASDPRSASFIDPMSGIELFRIGGNLGANVLINGASDSGLDYPRKLRNTNNSKGFITWNADSTLLMIERYFARNGDPSSPAQSYLIDVNASHGASVPWRIIRVNVTQDLNGAGGSNGGSSSWWFWDPLNPLRAYAQFNDGRLAEWWPIGGDGHSVGEINVLYGTLPAGFGSVHNSDDRPGASTPTPDGVLVSTPCRRNSDGRRGGFRRNLLTGALSSFVVSPDFNYTGSSLDHPDRCAGSVSAAGTYTPFNENGSRFKFKRWSDGVEVADTDPVNAATHTNMVLRDGVEYYCGVRTDNCSMFDIAAGTWEEKITAAQFQGNNPNHLGALNWNDTFETYGATGSGSSVGPRYFLYTRSGPRNGHTRAIMGIRMGINDVNQFRFICNHRGVRTDNSNECHAQMDPNAKYVVFPSNWQEANSGLSDDVHPYVAVLPDGWRSPNNDGS